LAIGALRFKLIKQYGAENMKLSKLLPLFVCMILSVFAFVGCGFSVSTPTPIVIITTATPQPIPTITPDLIATDVARQRAVAATLTAEAKSIQTTAPVVTETPVSVPTATPTPMPTPASRLYNFQTSDDPSQGQWRANVIAEYFYNGEWGAERIFVSATAWNETPAQILEIYSESQPITPGYGIVELQHLELHEGGKYWKTRIQLCMYAEGSVPRVHCQF
jgi:hypothetical protein